MVDHTTVALVAMRKNHEDGRFYAGVELLKGDEIYRVMSLVIERPSENQAVYFLCTEIARNVDDSTEVLKLLGNPPEFRHNVHRIKRRIGVHAPHLGVSIIRIRNLHGRNKHLQSLIDDAYRRGESLIADV